MSRSRSPKPLMHKNRLQEYSQRSLTALPLYQTINGGFQHAPEFRSTLMVDGETYTSSNTFSHRKAAEQNVAKLALECILKKIKNEECSPKPLMHKNRLQEYTQRSLSALPLYQTINEGFQHAPEFRSTVMVDGETYTSSNTFSHRKAAEQDVAKLALECISKKIKNEECPPIIEVLRNH
ncbi:hypothetical protein ACOSQ4_018114 [Xanthoceras sorbifolium]